MILCCADAAGEDGAEACGGADLEKAAGVEAFGDAAPGADSDMPLRSAELTIPRLAKNPGTYLQSVLVFLRAQNSPFRAASARVTRVGGKAALQIEFSAPSPLGLLGRHDS